MAIIYSLRTLLLTILDIRGGNHLFLLPPSDYS
jgi:hypothetical protein